MVYVITVLISCDQKRYLSTANNGKTSLLICNKCSLADKNLSKCGNLGELKKDIHVNLKMQINKKHVLPGKKPDTILGD